MESRFETGLPARTHHSATVKAWVFPFFRKSVVGTDASRRPQLTMTDPSNTYNEELSPLSTPQPNGIIPSTGSGKSDTHTQSLTPTLTNDAPKPRIYCLNTQRFAP